MRFLVVATAILGVSLMGTAGISSVARAEPHALSVPPEGLLMGLLGAGTPAAGVVLGGLGGDESRHRALLVREMLATHATAKRMPHPVVASPLPPKAPYSPSSGSSGDRADSPMPTLVVLPTGLALPVAGPVVRAYGDRDESGVASRGVTFAVAPRAPVVAPRPGRVMFAGPVRGYGNVVILQHNRGDYSLLAGLDHVTVPPGRLAERGDVVGTSGAGNGHERPQVYFEWRHQGTTADPLART